MTREKRQRTVARWRDFRGKKRSIKPARKPVGVEGPKWERWGPKGWDMPVSERWRWEAVLRCIKGTWVINDSKSGRGGVEYVNDDGIVKRPAPD